ncbi:MAG: MarR family winged helix-turn-helix transcriptional regulator [Armatimonadota bacterium]|jgi:DNA-binding MarR family transcriptional regulator
MKKESPAYAEHVLDLFTEIMHRIVILQPLNNLGANITQSLVQGMQYLFHHDACSVRDLAQGLDISYSASSQLVDRMVKKNLATRCENKDDRRISEICLTEEGRRIVEEIRLRRIDGISKILGKMDQSARKSLVANVETFITAAIGDEESAAETCLRCARDHLAECIVKEVYKRTMQPGDHS